MEWNRFYENKFQGRYCFLLHKLIRANELSTAAINLENVNWLIKKKKFKVEAIIDLIRNPFEYHGTRQNCCTIKKVPSNPISFREATLKIYLNW